MVQNLICFSSQYLICEKCQYTLSKKGQLLTDLLNHQPNDGSIDIESLREKQLFYIEVLSIREI